MVSTHALSSLGALGEPGAVWTAYLHGVTLPVDRVLRAWLCRAVAPVEMELQALVGAVGQTPSGHRTVRQRHLDYREPPQQAGRVTTAAHTDRTNCTSPIVFRGRSTKA